MNLKNICTISMAMLVTLTAWSQGKIPVNLYTGTGFVNIPIGAVRDKDLSEGVSLSYGTSGIKVEQQAGLVGLGWNLSAGGSISREMKGLPDNIDFTLSLEDVRKGWLENSNHSDAGSFVNTTTQTDGDCNGELATWGNLISLINDYKDDTEPDIFHFSFGGYSGKFVFDNTGQIKTIPYFDFDIAYTQTGPGLIDKFTVTTQDGTIYKFNANEYLSVRSYIQHPVADEPGDPVQFFYRDFIAHEPFSINYNAAWNLTEILSPVTDAKITFEYITSSVVYDDPVELMIAKHDANFEPEKQLFYFKRYNHDRKVLSKIKTDFNTEIEFNYSVANNDEFRRQLDAILVYNGASGTKELIRQFDMTYESFGIAFKDDITYERKFLKEV